MARRLKTTDAASDTVLKLAVLLQAGVAPAQAWRIWPTPGMRPRRA